MQESSSAELKIESLEEHVQWLLDYVHVTLYIRLAARVPGMLALTVWLKISFSTGISVKPTV
jgi:hypothetical protein